MEQPQAGGGLPPYIWPFATKDPKQYQRIDQGWDLCDTSTNPGNVYAVAGGTVSYAHDPGGFGNNYCVVKLDNPGYAPSIYYGHCVPVSSEGSHVNQADVVSTTSKGPQGNATQPGWLEIGWWDNGPVGRIELQASGGQGEAWTSAGQNMHDTLIGAPTFNGAGITPGSGGSGGGGTPSSNNANGGSNSNGYPGGQSSDSFSAFIKGLPDPRNNLPFSAAFMGQVLPFQTYGDLTMTSLQSPGAKPVRKLGSSIMPITQLVRGGMMELLAQQFKLYFMMNPQQINSDTSIDTSQLSPFAQNPAAYQYMPQGYVTSQSVTFTLYFNRMYEVWQGGFGGPSREGCRWDIRALERLCGIFDASKQNGNGSTVGLGNNGWGVQPAQLLPIQVVFGGDNSIQFQGTFTDVSYTFTLFDINMIPIEAVAQIEVMRVYNPGQSSPDLVASLQTTTGQVGPQATGNLLWGNQGPFTK